MIENVAQGGRKMVNVANNCSRTILISIVNFAYSQKLIIVAQYKLLLSTVNTNTTSFRANVYNIDYHFIVVTALFCQGNGTAQWGKNHVTT